MTAMLRRLSIFLCLSLICAFAAEYSCSFVEGGWDMKDWHFVRSGRWPYEGHWVQKENCIQNVVPEGVGPVELQGKRAGETYTSMVLAKPVNGSATIRATMSFEYKMAPLIVLAGPLKENGEAYPEYQEHWEIVLYNEGINVWHHEVRDGKPYWRKAAYVQAKFEAGKQYEMTAKVQFTAKVPMLEVKCGDCVFGCMLPTLPKNYYAGITACEGVNAFYNFKIISK